MTNREVAKPLDDELFAEMVECDMHDLITIIDDVLYSDEDLYACDGCDLLTPDPADLDNDGFCEECAVEGIRHRDHMNELYSDYKQSAL